MSETHASPANGHAAGGPADGSAPPAVVEHLVDLRGVTKSFDDKPVLRGLDLRVGPGEIVGFVGRNGAGKSTTLRICVGIDRRDGGHAELLGLDPRRHSLAIRRQCHYLPGESSVYHQLTGEMFEDFALAGYHRDRTMLDVAPELFDLPMHKSIRSYSAGMKQRLTLRAAVQADVPLQILDEPDRALDATARMQLRSVLVALRDKGRGVLLSTHHLGEIEAIADRTAFLMDGVCVPEERVRAARDSLREELRLRLRDPDAALPPGTTSVERLPDGTLRVRTEGDPLLWLRTVDRASIESVELGASRLEDIYRQLAASEADR